MESLWCALQDEVHITVAALLGDPWRYPRWPPFWAPSWFLPKIKNCQNTLKIGSFRCWTCRIWHNSLLLFVDISCTFHLKRVKNRHFSSKWLNHLLLMTSYLVTITTDSHQTCVKIFPRDHAQLLKTADVEDNSSWKNSRKTLWGVGLHRPPRTPEG